MITPESIQRVKDAAKADEVIGDFIELKKEGHNKVAKCPFHNEKTASFSVSKEKNIYKCFGCGASGDAIKFLMDYKQMNFPDAVKWLAEKYNIDLEEVKRNKDYVRPRPAPSKPATYLETFLKSRGISIETAISLGVTQCLEWMPKAQKETDAICFNYFRDGELINIKYRADNKDFKLVKDAELIFYNIDSTKATDAIVIVEGEMDCLSLWEAGVRHVISVPNGATTGNINLEYLDNCWQHFDDLTQIVIMTDNDDPGNALREELARRLGKSRCFMVHWPDGCKDANDILIKYGKQGLRDAISNIYEFPIEGIISMDEMYPEVVKYYKDGYPTGIKVGIDGLDEKLSFMQGQITVVTGIPGSGKSEFIDYVMAKAALNHDWAFGVCSFENQPASFHVTKLMEKFTGKSFAFRQNPYSRMNTTEFDSAAEYVSRYFHFININQVEVTLQGILDKAKELVLKKGIKGLLIDPWNYIEHRLLPTQTETQYVSECLTLLKAFALTNGVHIFLIAHPTKLKKEANKKYEVPTLYHISGSAHFFNKTDNGISIYRDFESNEVDVYVQKVRYSWLGKVGLCSFNFNTETRQYQSINK